MKGLFFIMFSTFVMGIFSGMYVYLNTQDQAPDTPKIFTQAADNNLTRGFEVTGDMTGACVETGDCVSYHITADGVLTRVTYRATGAPEKRAQKLSEAELSALVVDLRATPFDSLQKRTLACDRMHTRVMQYSIRIGDAMYRINTCTDVFEGALASRLLGYSK